MAHLPLVPPGGRGKEASDACARVSECMTGPQEDLEDLD